MTPSPASSLLRALLCTVLPLIVALALRTRLGELADGTTLLTPDAAAAAVAAALPVATTAADRSWYLERTRASVEAALTRPAESRGTYSALAPSVDTSVAGLPEEVRGRLDVARTRGSTRVAALAPAPLTRAMRALRADHIGIRTAVELRGIIDHAWGVAGGTWLLLLGLLAFCDMRLRTVRGGAWVAASGLATVSFVGLAAQATVGGVYENLDVTRHATILAAGVALGALAGLTGPRIAGVAADGIAGVRARWAGMDRLAASLRPGTGLLVLCLVAIGALLLRAVRQEDSRALLDLRVFGQTFQPLEFVKFGIVVALARYVGELPADESAARRASDLLVPLLAGVALVLTAFGLSDFGTVIVSLPAVALVLFIALGLRALPTAVMLFGVAASALLLPASPALAGVLPAKFAGRLVMYADAWSNGYEDLRQAAQAAWSMAAGGRWGRPLETLDPHDLPVRHADMVFAWWIEGFGAYAGAGLVLLFFVVGAALVRLALNATAGDLRTRLAALAIPCVLLAQVAVNVATTRGDIPLTGIVLPLVSSGGTSWLAFSGACTLLLVAASVTGQGRGADDTHHAAAVVLMAGALAVAVFDGAVLANAGSRADVTSLRVLLSSGAPYYAGAPGTLVAMSNPRLERIVEAVDPPAIEDRVGRTVASGPAADRSYAFGAALTPTVGVSRLGVRPLGGTVESRVVKQHLVPTRAVPTHSGVLYTPDLRAVAHLLRAPGAERDAETARLGATTGATRVTLDAALSADLYRKADRYRTYATDGKRRRRPLDALVVVVDDTATGERLLELSVPSVDPTQVTEAVLATEAKGEWGRLQDYARHPLSPGSTFKPLTSMALLEGEDEDPSAIHCVCDKDSSDPRIAAAGKKCHNGHHGDITLRTAHKVSCNACFAQFARQVGREDLHDFARRLPLVNFERTGPTAELLDAGFGQGRVLMTASELTRYYAAIANGGSLPLCESLIADPAGGGCPMVTLTSTRIADAEELLLGAVMEPGGTGAGARAPAGASYRIVGKTGTAEADAIASEFFRNADGTTRRPGNADHAWFAAIVTGGGRSYAVTVLAPRGDGYGGVVAAPFVTVVADALERYGYLGTPAIDG